MFFLLWSLLFKFQDIKSYLHDYFSICDSKCFYIAMWTYGASPPVSSQLDRPLQIWLNSVWLLQRWCLFTQKPINIIQTSSKPNRSISCAYIQTKNLNTSICKCLLQLRNDFQKIFIMGIDSTTTFQGTNMTYPYISHLSREKPENHHPLKHTGIVRRYVTSQEGTLPKFNSSPALKTHYLPNRKVYTLSTFNHTFSGAMLVKPWRRVGNRAHTSGQSFRAFWGSSLTIWGEPNRRDSVAKSPNKNLFQKTTTKQNSHTKPRRSQKLGCFHLVAGWTNPLWKNMLVKLGSSSPIFGVKNFQKTWKRVATTQNGNLRKSWVVFPPKWYWNLHPTCECWEDFPPKTQLARQRPGRLEGRMSIKEPNWNDARRLTFKKGKKWRPQRFGP